MLKPLQQQVLNVGRNLNNQNTIMNTGTIRNLTAFLFFVSSLTLFGCQKNDTTPPQANPTSKRGMLTSYVYIYDSVYSNWGTAQQSLIYAKNATVNVQDWSKARVKFYLDGTFDEILTTGIWRQGNWSFNSDSTILNTSGGGYSNSAKIELLDETKLIWTSAGLRGVQSIKK